MNAKRTTLADLQRPAPAAIPPMPSRPADAQSPVQQTPEVRSTGERKQQSPEAPPSRPPRQRRAPAVARSRTPEVQTPELPKYLRLERKELLIWPDQITQLSILARTLNRRRGGDGERITTNTLIRVFVAAGLARADQLAGTTEDDLRRSLGLSD
jgi:hypothetical protein